MYTDLFLQAVAKTSAAPIERIKLLVQNQDEMVGLLLLLELSCVSHLLLSDQARSSRLPLQGHC